MELESRLHQLVDLIKKDEFYFEEFFELTKKQIYYNIYALLKDHQLAEDALQETYVVFLNSIHKVNKKKSVLGFLYKISRNKAIDFYRKRKSEVPLEKMENYIESSVEHTYDDSERLLKKLQSILNDKEYEIVIMHVISEMTHKEIGQLYKIPTNTVIWVYNKAIKKIKERLGDSYA